MEVIYSEKALSHIAFWKKSGNLIIQKKIQQLIEAIKIDFYNGIGKPEPLKHQLTGLWSRRINLEHRLIYQLDEENKRIIIHTLKGHY